MKRILTSGRSASHVTAFRYSDAQHGRKGHLLQVVSLLFAVVAGAQWEGSEDHISTSHQGPGFADRCSGLDEGAPAEGRASCRSGASNISLFALQLYSREP